MNTTENIISIRNRDINEANKAFAEFMSLSEKEFNARSEKDHGLYKGITPFELEEVTEKLLKDISPQTPFKADDIKLISGHSFPDIMATDYYGVEVKSTKDGKWTSVGSSIVESTRNATVERIYMLFGNLGGDPPTFMCRPYQDCLSNIYVTHSPRYMIDMKIKEKGDKTIFEKIHIPYDKFRKEENKIEYVRDYYIQQSRSEGRHEMPWWVGKKTIETDYNTELPQIKIYNELNVVEKNDLKAQMTILFPQVIKGDYADAALWLCTHRYLLCLNMRDFYSAGGQYKYLNGNLLPVPYPAVLKKLMDIMPDVKNNLTNNEGLEYSEFNSPLNHAPNKLDIWIKQVYDIFSNYSYIVDKHQVNFSDLDIDVTDFLLNPQKYVLTQK